MVSEIENKPSLKYTDYNMNGSDKTFKSFTPENELSLNSIVSNNIITKDDPNVESVSLEWHECVNHFFLHIKKF